MVAQIDHLNLTVKSFAESAKWYDMIFGFKIVEQGEIDGVPWGILKSGESMLCIYEHKHNNFLNRFKLKEKSQHGLNHFALKITNRSQWEATVNEQKLKINYGGEVKWPHSSSWYLNDPTGYEIEVVLWNKNKPAFS